MNKLSRFLEELASSGPVEHRAQLSKQVDALRATVKKQREYCTKLLQLSEEYASVYLLDISDEIQRQRDFLDILERRLETAKRLLGEVSDLRRSYESGTVHTMKGVRATGKQPPVTYRGNILRLSISSTITAASTGLRPVQRGRLCANQDSRMLHGIGQILDGGDIPRV